MSLDIVFAKLAAHQHRLRMGLIVSGALACVWFLILIAKIFLSSPGVFAEIHLDEPTKSNPRWNWYTAAPVEEAPVEEEDIAEAKISAELLGVVIAGERSVATIAVSRQTPEIFQIGDELQRNVTLEAVEPYRVIISETGVRRQLLLKSVTGEVVSASDEQDQLIRVNQTSQSQSQAGFTLPGVGSTTPIQVPGEGMGLKLSGVSSDISDLADLRDGDVVMEINGTQVADLFTNPLLWQQFRQETSLPMTVMRDGERAEVYVNAASLFEKIIPQLGAGLIQ